MNSKSSILKHDATKTGGNKILKKPILLEYSEIQTNNKDVKVKNIFDFITGDNFLKIISHDLKNQLITIRLISQLLYEGFDKIERDDIHSHISRIHKASNHANIIVDNLTGLIHLYNNSLNLIFEDENCSLFVQYVKNLGEANAGQKNINICLKPLSTLESLKVKVDTKWFNRALDNIFSCIVEYIFANSIFEISFRSVNNKQVAIKFKCQLDPIFLKKVQETKEVSLNGLLDFHESDIRVFIANQIVFLHGGKILYNCLNDTLTEIEIMIPLSQSI